MRRLACRKYRWAVDPFSSELRNNSAIRAILPDNVDDAINPLKPADDLANNSRLLKVVAGIFSSLVAYSLNKFVADKEKAAAEARAEADDDSESITTQSPVEKIAPFIRAFFNSCVREHRSLTADFALVLKTLGGLRTGIINLDGKPVPSSGLLELDRAAGSLGLSNTLFDGLPALVWLKTYFPKEVYTPMCRKIRRYGLKRASLLASSPSLVPRRFLFLDELNASSFSAHSSSNPLSFIKFLIDSAQLVNKNEAGPTARGNIIFRLLAKASFLGRSYCAKGNSTFSNSFIFNKKHNIPRVTLREFRNTLMRRNYAVKALCKKHGVKLGYVLYNVALLRWMYIGQYLDFRKARSALRRRRTRPGALNFGANKKGDLRGDSHLFTHFLTDTSNRFFNISSPYKLRGVEYVANTSAARYNFVFRRVFKKIFISKNYDYLMYLRLRIKHKRPGSFISNFSTGAPSTHFFSLAKIGRAVNAMQHKGYSLRMTEIVGRRSLSSKYLRYYFKYVWARRVKAFLNVACNAVAPAPLTKGNGARLKKMFSNVYRAFTQKRRRTLFKINPDLVGRSRVFYYVQKKPWLQRKFNKAYRLTLSLAPAINMKTRRYMSIGRNSHLAYRNATRINHRRSFRYKAVLRHVLRRE